MLVNLRVLFARLIDIILLRAGPESLPASASLLAVVIALNVAVSAIITSLISTAPSRLSVEFLLDIVVALVWFQVAFSLVNKRERFVQTMTAFFGVFTLFLPVLLPLAIALLPYTIKPDPANPPPTLPTLVGAALVIWLLVVLVRIVKAAFEWPYIAAIVFIFGLRIATALVYAMLFGIPSKPV
jgi:hypothetical protein